MKKGRNSEDTQDIIIAELLIFVFYDKYTKKIQTYFYLTLQILSFKVFWHQYIF